VANLSQNVRHSACGKNMQISTVDAIRCVLRDSSAIQIGSHVVEPDTFAYRKDIVSMNSTQDDLKHSALNKGLVLLFDLSF